jgi:Glycogen recognition site of AMP-activated protein kinase
MHPDDRSDEPPDPFVERLAARLREPVTLSPEVERVVLDRLRARPFRRRWPAVATALAAGIAAAFAAGLLVGRWTAAPPAGALSVRPIEFALRTPADSAVALVGDFNDWNPAATPLHRAADDVWSVTVPLRPGRYRYTFIVDGTRWRRDPTAPPALEDDFGAPTSVITIAQR